MGCMFSSLWRPHLLLTNAFNSRFSSEHTCTCFLLSVYPSIFVLLFFTLYNCVCVNFSLFLLLCWYRHVFVAPSTSTAMMMTLVSLLRLSLLQLWWLVAACYRIDVRSKRSFVRVCCCVSINAIQYPCLSIALGNNATIGFSHTELFRCERNTI